MSYLGVAYHVSWVFYLFHLIQFYSLLSVQCVVEALHGHQFFVAALLRNALVGNVEDAVSAANSNILFSQNLNFWSNMAE